MNSTNSTEMYIPANISGPNITRKYLTRDIPTTSTSYAVDIGSWILSNGTSLFEAWIQVNTSGFTISKYYKFSVINNATSGIWHKVSPEVTSGASSSNDFELEINVNSTICYFRLHRTGGSTAGEAKIHIVKYGSTDDSFTASTTSANVGAVSTTGYSRSYGVNYVLLSEANIFAADLTVNSRLIAKGDNTNYPAIRLGGGSGNLSTNQSKDGSIILQGTTTQGTRSQFEIVAPNTGSRIVMEAHNSDGVSLFAMGSHLKFNQNSGSFLIGGTHSTNGLFFGSGIGSGMNADVALTRMSSGNLKIFNGTSSLSALSVSNLRLNSLDTTKTQLLYGSGEFIYLENRVGYPAFVSNFTGGYATALVAGKSGSTLSYDQSGPFSIVAQATSNVLTSPGSGLFYPRLTINTNGDIAIGHSNPSYKVDIVGSLKADTLYGNGANITGLSTSNLVGTLPSGQMPLPTTTTVGAIKRNTGSSGTYVTGVGTDGSLQYSQVLNPPTKTIAKCHPITWETDNAANVPQTGSINNHRVLNFEQTTNRYAIWTNIVPEGTLLTSGIDVYAWWSSDVTFGNVGWLVSVEKVSNGATISSDNFCSEVTIPASTVPSAGLIKKTNVNIPSASLSGLSNGDLFRFKIGRDVAVDTAAGNARLHMVEIRAAI